MEGLFRILADYRKRQKHICSKLSFYFSGFPSVQRYTKDRYENWELCNHESHGAECPGARPGVQRGVVHRRGQRGEGEGDQSHQHLQYGRHQFINGAF